MEGWDEFAAVGFAQGLRVDVLDEEEFEARGFSSEVREGASGGLGELQEMARSATPPFDSTSSLLSLGRAH